MRTDAEIKTLIQRLTGRIKRPLTTKPNEDIETVKIRAMGRIEDMAQLQILWWVRGDPPTWLE